MELNLNYQYTYFIYPYAIKTEKYKKYITSMIKNKNYHLKFFDGFKDIGLYNYFMPSIKSNTFQDFTFSKEKLDAFYKLSKQSQYNVLNKQNCIMFEYNLAQELQGKLEEKDGIFFKITKIDLVCFKTGICFLIFKTHMEETNEFSDLLNFNYKFSNLNLENKKLEKIDKIKIQTDAFSNIKKLTEIIAEITGKKIDSKQLDIDDDLFLTYAYACVDSKYWNKNTDFENIENEFIKLSEIKPSNTSVEVDYEKLTMITNSSYMKIRINNKGCFLICSSTDKNNYTKLPTLYENQYLYTYLLALHQRYYLKKLSKEFSETRNIKNVMNKFIDFTQNIWINEITTEALGQKIYKRCREKLNLQELYQEVKIKYDTYYKEARIEKNIKQNKIIIVLAIIAIIFGIANLSSWLFFK